MNYQCLTLSARGVSHTGATLTCYCLDNTWETDEKRVRPAVIVCPGGGYEYTSDREAEPIAIQCLAAGFQAFVLRYHIKPDVYPTALLDAAESVLTVRRRAAEFHVDPDKIVVLGFSAGGHLAGHISNRWNEPFVAQALGCQSEEMRVNGNVLCYPVITSGEWAHRGSFQALLAEKHDALCPQMSLENCVGPQTPPTFLWHTYPDDAVPVQNTMLYFDALRRQNVPCELHIFPEGCHGLSLANEETRTSSGGGVVPACQSWISLCTRWIAAL